MVRRIRRRIEEIKRRRAGLRKNKMEERIFKMGGMEYTVKDELHEIPGTNGKAFTAEAFSLRTKKKFWIGWIDITKKKDPFSAPDFLSNKSEEELIEEMKLKNK